MSMDADSRSLRSDAHIILRRLRRLDSSAHDGGTLQADEIEAIHDDVVDLQRRLITMMNANVAGPGILDELIAAAGSLNQAQQLVQRLLTELGDH